MTVAAFRNIESNFLLSQADENIMLLERQKLGYSLKKSFLDKQKTINLILLESIAASNQILQPLDNVRIPSWTDKISFSNFMLKIKNHASSNFS